VLSRPDLLLVVADRVQDPGNLGTIVRVADAAGATAVAVTRGSVDPHNPKAVRATMGSLFHLPVAEVERAELLGALTDRGVRILVADPRGAVEYTTASYAPPVALVVGGEAGGAHPAWQEAAAATLRIPLYGRAESLNVAIAAALLLYEARRPREG
jgi:TrmH family RNA methyltransferase